MRSNNFINKSDNNSVNNEVVPQKNTTMSVLQSILQAGSNDSMPISVTRCNACLACLRDLIRQAYDLILPGSPHYSVILMKTPLSPADTAKILESLQLPEHPFYVRRSALSATTGKLTRISPKSTKLNPNQMDTSSNRAVSYQSSEPGAQGSEWIR
ncbi:unnamed protein product [Trichobilharzia regenti]|nr:unnamed protein product [Trichobilharzia regenti]